MSRPAGEGAYTISARGLTRFELADYQGQPIKRALTDNDRRVIQSADCASGTTAASVMQLLSMQKAQSNNICARLADEHYLTCVSAGRFTVKQFFARSADAVNWVESQVLARAAAEKLSAAAPAAKPVAVSLPRDKRAPKNITFCPPKRDGKKPPPVGKPVITERTITTRDMTARPSARWQLQELAPDPRWPSFAATRIGVNPVTGLAWEDRG